VFEHQAVVPAAMFGVGIVWNVLMVGAVAVLLGDAFPRAPRTPERLQPAGRRRLPAGARPRPAGAAPARSAHGAAA